MMEYTQTATDYIDLIKLNTISKPTSDNYTSVAWANFKILHKIILPQSPPEISAQAHPLTILESLQID